MSVTTIKIHGETKLGLDKFREYVNESYDEVIKKLLYIVGNIKDKPELSQEVIEAIELARKRIKRGKFVSEKEMAKRLGL